MASISNFSNRAPVIGHRTKRLQRLPPCAAKRDKQAASSSKPQQAPPPPVQQAPEPEEELSTGPPIIREFRALGSQVIEQSLPFEEPPTEDWWEGEKFEGLGSYLERFFVPTLVVLAVACGGYAASHYSDDAEVFIQSASSPEGTMKVVPAERVLQAPSTSNQEQPHPM